MAKDLSSTKRRKEVEQEVVRSAGKAEYPIPDKGSRAQRVGAIGNKKKS